MCVQGKADREISFTNTYVIFYPHKPSELFKEKKGLKSEGGIIYRTKVLLDTFIQDTTCGFLLKSSSNLQRSVTFGLVVILGGTATF